MTEPTHRPEPGRHGDYADSCVVCMRGTDTGVIFQGPPEWPVAALVHLGVPRGEAKDMVLYALEGRELGPEVEVEVGVHLCQRCADRPVAPLPVGYDPLPVVEEPPHLPDWEGAWLGTPRP